MPVIFGPISIAIVLFLVIRVWWEIEKDKMKKPPKNKP
jgi:hypothetical protein